MPAQTAAPAAATQATPPRKLRLRPYQREASLAVLRSVRERLGRTITIEIARQGGKNELSAHIEVLVLAGASNRARDAIKTAPTFRPQLRMSMHRLWQRIAQSGYAVAAKRTGNAISIDHARLLFLSAEPGANVVGHTASLLLEVDEAQDIDPEKFDRDFRPMASTANATCVMYGTAWDDRTLLERQKQANLEAERRDGERRHFSYDWQIVARWNPAYAGYVESERQRLGETHPLFLTQYCLKPIAGGGRLFSASQRAQLEGAHSRLAQPIAGEAYVAGLDLAGGDDLPLTPNPSPTRGEGSDHDLPLSAKSERGPAEGSPRRGGEARDSTVLTIGRLRYDAALPWTSEPRVEIVEHIAWTGEPHEALLPRLIDLLRNVWRVERVWRRCHRPRRDGGAAARGHARRVAGRRRQVQRRKQVQARIRAARRRQRRPPQDVSRRRIAGASRKRQAEAARAAYRANRTMNFFVEPAEGHDDYVISAALLVHASRGRVRRVATGRVRA